MKKGKEKSKKGKGKKQKKIGGQDRVKAIRYEKIKELVDADIENLKMVTHKSIVTTKINCDENILVNYMVYCLRLVEYYVKKGKHHNQRYDATMSLSRAIREFETIEFMPKALIKDAKRVYKKISGDPDKIDVKKIYKKIFWFNYTIKI